MIGQNRTRPPFDILYPNSATNANAATDIDIIAVHGLGSDVDWSWTWKDGKKHVHWLRDPEMLPHKLPRLRTILYSYDSRWGIDAPHTRLELCGEDLIHALHSFRETSCTRPTIFIGHSLGGNVILHALLYAHFEDRYRYLLTQTVGLVFLGTPFRGTRFSALAESVARLAKWAGSHHGIIRELSLDSPALLDKLHSFCRVCNMLSMPVSCFNELYETDYGWRYGFNGFMKGMVVEEASACIPGYGRGSLQADHLKINKYSSPTDRSYLAVSAAISDMCVNAGAIIKLRETPKEIITDNTILLRNRPEAEQCMRELFATDPSEDREGLKRKRGDRAHDTCKWILGTEVITSWLDFSTPVRKGTATAKQLLWLHGNPGIGKSTMVIYLTEELEKSFVRTDKKTLAYFFCDSGFDTRRTAPAIVRGLLVQLVWQHPKLVDYVLPKHKERGAALFNSFDALWKIFMAVINDPYTGRKYCIIDALDECDKESRVVLLRQLEEAFQSQRLSQNIRMLVTSRSYLEIEEYLIHFPSKNLATFYDIKLDIGRFIKEKVDYLAKRKRYTDKIKSQVSNMLKSKAENTFLWIGLACRELEDVPSKDAIKILRSMPKGIPLLYSSLLDKARQQNENDVEAIRRILSCIAVSLRPLSLWELADACQLHQDEDDKETRLQFTREQVATFHLLIIVQADTVLFLHQSVKDFIVGPEYHHLISIPEAHAELCYRCLDVLIQQFHAKDRANMWSYAAYSWATHARHARTKFEIREVHAEFFAVDSPSRQHWLQHFFIGRAPSEFSILHVAARWGISAILDHISKQNSSADGATAASSHCVDFNATDSRGTTPLEQAVQFGHADVVEALLLLQARVTPEAVRHTARNEVCGKHLMQLLLDKPEGLSKVTDDATIAAARNGQSGTEVMAILLDRCHDALVVTDAMVLAAAENLISGKDIMDLFLDRCGKNVNITKEVLQAAARNHGQGYKILHMLVKRRPHEVVITKDIIKAASANDVSGAAIMTLFLTQKDCHISITEPVITIILEKFSEPVVRLLLDQYGKQVTVTAEVVRAVTRNETGPNQVMKCLLELQQHHIAITEQLMAVVVESFDDQLVKMVLHRHGNDISITEEIVESAARNYKNRQALMCLLLDHWKGEAAETRVHNQATDERGPADDTRVSPFRLWERLSDSDYGPRETVLELSDEGDEVWGVSFSNDGRWLAAYGASSTVIVWDVPSFVKSRSLGGYNGSIGALTWTPDNSKVITCSTAGHAKVWDIRSGTVLATLEGCDKPMSGCVWAGNGETCVTGSVHLEQALKTWNTNNMEMLHDWNKSHRAQSICGNDSRIIVIDDYTSVHVYRAVNRELEFSMPLSHRPSSVCLARDGKYILVNTLGGELLLLDLATQSLVRKYTGQTAGKCMIQCAFGGTDEELVLCGSDDGRILIWDRRTAIIVAQLEGHDIRANAVSWHPNHPCMMASGGDDGKVKIWSNRSRVETLRASTVVTNQQD